MGAFSPVLQVVQPTSTMEVHWRPTPLSCPFESLFQIVAIQKKYGAIMQPILQVLRRKFDSLFVTGIKTN